MTIEPSALVAGVPQGLGMYVGRGGITAARARELARIGHVRHVALCAEAVDSWRATPQQLRDLGNICRDVGIVPHVYVFPGLGRARQPHAVAQWLVASLRLAGGACPVPDLEGAYQRRPQLLLALLDALLELCTDDELDRLLITTFGAPSDRGTKWPWTELASWVAKTRALTGRPIGTMGWQCYLRAGVESRVREGLAEHAAIWTRHRVLPHVATFRRRNEARGEEEPDGPARLTADLRRTCLDDAGVCTVPGAWLWWGASTSRDELRAMARFADRVGW